MTRYLHGGSFFMQSPKTATDHDLLITVNVKLDNLAADVKTIGDGTTKELNDHESRLKTIEVGIQKYNADDLVKRFFYLEQEVHDFKTTALAYRAFAGMLGGVIFFLLTQLPTILKFFFPKL